MSSNVALVGYAAVPVGRLQAGLGAPLQVLDRATTPDTRSGPHRSLFMLFGVFAGLAFGTGRALLQAMKEPS